MLVRKYGGSSLKTMEQIREICQTLPGEPFVLVLSAAEGRTDELYATATGCDEENNHHIALGELESCLRLWSMLDMQNRDAEIIPYKRIGITASMPHGGRIVSCDPSYIRSVLERGVIAIVPGFQGMYDNKIAILERGASDDTAVALASMLKVRCEIYSDVPYIYDDNYQRISTIDYDHLSKIVGKQTAPISQGAIYLAQQANTEIYFNHWCGKGEGTLVKNSTKCTESC